MKRKPVSMMTIVPAVLLLAGAAGAQQAPPPQAPQAQPAVPTTTQNNQCAGGSNCYDRSTTDRDTSGQSVQSQAFSSLAGSKGYVTQSDARNDPWLAHHFDQCDKNQDGRITRSEYRECHRRNASGGQS